LDTGGPASYRGFEGLGGFNKANRPGCRGNVHFVLLHLVQDLGELRQKCGIFTSCEFVIPVACYSSMTISDQTGSQVVRFPQKSQRPVVFDRKELGQLMGLYGRRVAEGEWRDYAMDFGTTAARFDIHRRASEQPLYSVVKTPELSTKGGLFQVVAQGGLILKRGNDLTQVLRVLDKKPKLQTV
jgi:hypothetical protein